MDPSLINLLKGDFMKKYLTFLALLVACLLFQQKASAEQTIFIFLGPPAAGKGVLCKKLSRESKLPHISTGDLLRQEQNKQESPLAIELSEYMKEGQLVPDEMIVKVLMSRIQKEDCKEGFILDGFPRTLNQAKILDEALPTQHQLVVVNLKVDEELSVKRLLGRRTCADCTQPYHVEFLPPKKEGICDHCNGKLIERNDDCEAAIRNRLEIFKDQFGPIEAYYKDSQKWVEVQTDTPVEQTYSNLLNQINAFSIDQLVLEAK